MIQKKTIEEIIEVAKIEEVVGDYVNLRRRGANLIGLCPFHAEKTPSFTVSPVKNIYKCFGCGRGGDPIHFIMEHDKLSYPEALRLLAKKYNIEIDEIIQTPEHVQEQLLTESLYLITAFAQTFFTEQLWNTDIGKSVGLAYFKHRQFSEKTIRAFGLGYASDDKDALTKAALNKGFKLELLQKAGVTTANSADFFRGRVQFPIQNVSGKIIGFGGRILGANTKQPKYLNTPETDIYTKSNVLYGISLAKKAIRQADECILVEGYTDVISLHQAGIENAVASSGTSLTINQLHLIKRYTPNIKIIYDGDGAGIKAALRGLDLVLQEGLNVQVVLLPKGEDPDSYLQKVGAKVFAEYIEKQATDFILFKTNLLLAETQNNPIKRAELVKDIVESIAKIPDSVKRAVYIRACSEKMNIEERVIVNEMNKAIQRGFKKAADAPETLENELPPDDPTQESEDNTPLDIPTQTRTLSDEFQEKDLVRILIEFGDKWLEPNIQVAQYVLADMEDIIEDFDQRLYQEVVKHCLEELQKGNIHPPAYFLSHANSSWQKIAVNLLSSPYEYSENWEKRLHSPLQTQPLPSENFRQDTIESVNRFKLKKVVRLYKKNQERLKNLTPGEAEKLFYFLKIQQKLGKLRGTLAELLGVVVLP